MVKLTGLYGHPDDPNAFENLYANENRARWNSRPATTKPARCPA